MNEALLANAVKLHQAGQLTEAAKLYGTILRASPRHFEALYFLGFIHFQRGEFGQAERLMGDALLANPRSADAHYNRGCALQHLQRHEEAVTEFGRALACKPDYADAASNRATALMALSRTAEALQGFDAALKLNPYDKEALSNRGTVLFELKRYGEAAANYERLLALDGDFPYACGSLALARAYACDWRNREKDHGDIHMAIRAGKPALAPHAATLILDNAEDQLISARLWTATRGPARTEPLWNGQRYRHDRIRLAYVSADFHGHATAYLAAGLFETHDRGRFDTVAISLGPDDASPMRTRLKGAFGRFIDVRTRNDTDIARLLREMEIDIAVDLKGFTQDARPGIFASRPAPVQVNYLGHPGTMGASYIDYIVADRVTIPDSQRAFYSEKIVLLPGSYQCNDSRRVIDPQTPVRVAAGLPEKGFVFASFNNLYKITPAVFAIWMRLLDTVEGSVLWLLDDNREAVAHLKHEAQARGVAADRIIFAARVPVEMHLARQRLADLFLDTLPCNAHTTASDALWAGLPVLACLGTTFAGRVAASLLCAAGLPQLVVESLQDYEALALRLAREPKALAEIREKLAQNRDRCALFDTVKTTRDLESAYLAMMERMERGLPPADLSVPA